VHRANEDGKVLEAIFATVCIVLFLPKTSGHIGIKKFQQELKEWHEPSKLLVSRLEAKLPESNSPQRYLLFAPKLPLLHMNKLFLSATPFRLQGNQPLVLELSRSLTDIARELSHFARFANTRNLLTCSLESFLSNA
jgi:hypothetical protein